MAHKAKFESSFWTATSTKVCWTAASIRPERAALTLIGTPSQVLPSFLAKQSSGFRQ